MNVFYVFGVMVVFFCVLLTIIMRAEKLMVWPYGDPEPLPPFGDPKGFAQERIDDIAQAGFTFLGWSRDLKGATYQVSYAMQVSPEHDIMAITGNGTVAGMPVKGTWLYTPSSDGRVYYTVDTQSGVKLDLTRNWTSHLVMTKRFAGLLQAHRDWIRDLAVMPRGLTQGREFADFREVRIQHFRELERAGHIYFTDHQQTHYRYTWSGAAKTAISNYLIGLVRGMTAGRIPRSA